MVNGTAWEIQEGGISFVCANYNMRSAPCPVQEWPPAMRIRRVWTGPRGVHRNRGHVSRPPADSIKYGSKVDRDLVGTPRVVTRITSEVDSLPGFREKRDPDHRRPVKVGLLFIEEYAR